MERLSKIACCFRWAWGGHRGPHAESVRRVERDVETSKRLFGILESILLWENSVNSISVVIVFNILFWGIVVLEIRGFAAASSAALVVILCYSTLEAQVEKEKGASESTTAHPKPEKIDKIITKVKSTCDSLRTLRENQPGVFCAGVCSASLVLWLIGRAISGVLLTYTLCMSILLGPVLLLRLPSKICPTKEWDNEIEEFLPAVTEDNLEVLKRAGEDGDHSPTPPSGSKTPNDPFNDDELIGLKMPSHEDGSTDGLELSELELSTEGDNDVADIKIQTGHFEGSSSSDDDGELELKNPETSSNSDNSESEFEIIDSLEITGLDSKL
ncbi:reticulophagy regulator 3 [Diachasma alloeum]|uniref:reticulophagy regulator 3 n=1 Tax=Diachasma alloeum TaxID=454923 RepID=UPI0007384133|nr:reticulophagy regulator 3 [Diachasma alloeum]